MPLAAGFARPPYFNPDGTFPSQAWTDAYQFVVRKDGLDAPISYKYVPTPKGLEFHECGAPNAILEGSRGTGKSVTIRNDAHMRALAIPGLTYLIIRRTMPELKLSHLRFIGKEMKGIGGGYHQTDAVATYPNGSQGYFRQCETEDDMLKLLSSEFDIIYFDEITTFTWSMVTKISSCIRVPEDGHRLGLVRGGTNPIGIGADEVYHYYIARDVTPEEDQDYNAEDYVSIKTLLEDNPYLDMVQYRKRLASQPEHYRKAWLDGIWIREGTYFSDFQPEREGKPFHVVHELPLISLNDGYRYRVLDLEWINIYRVVDWGFYPDPACCLWIAVLPNGAGVVFKEMTWLRTTAANVAKEIATASEHMRIVETFCDPTMFINEEATGNSIGSIFELNGIPLTQSKNDRVAVGLAIHEWLNTQIDGYGPKLTIMKGGSAGGLGCTMLIKTLPTLRIDKTNNAKIAPGNDHWTIAVGYFCMANIVASRQPFTSSIPTWMRPKKGDRQVLGSKQVRTRSH